VLHGVGGEDGTIQAQLAAAGVRCVGADATASHTGMHKAAMKEAFARAGLPQTEHVVVTAAEWDEDAEVVRARIASLSLPWFTKPARQGSSIGITRVTDPDTLGAALAVAFAHDDTVVVETGIVSVRELEVGVLEGQDGVRVSAPGEIVPSHEFYDFEAKYLDESELVVPAVVDAEVLAACRSLGRAAFDAIGCRGMARVDLFLTDDGRLLVNEINTIPGFTDRSMFPRLWQAEGVDYPTLIDLLLDGARV
jgi:D-alanine-D-alanine ligase